MVKAWSATVEQSPEKSEATKRAVGQIFNAIEAELGNVSLQVSSYASQPEQDARWQREVDEQNCSVYEQPQTNNRLSQYNVTYLFNKASQSYGRHCDEIIVVMLQFYWQNASQFILENDKKQNKCEGAKTERVVVPHGVPYLSLKGREARRHTELQGVVDYEIKPSLDEILEKDVFTFLYENKKGDTVVLYDVDFRCVYVNTELGEFSSFGLERLDDTTFGPVVCRSNHTTIFALLLSLKAVAVPWGVKVGTARVAMPKQCVVRSNK